MRSPTLSIPLSETFRAIVLATVLLPAGCGQPAAPPASGPPVNGAPSAAAGPQSPPPDVPNELTLEPGFQWIAFVECSQFPEDAGNWSASGERTFETTGKPKSYLYTKKEYGNFTLRYDTRFPSPPKDPAKAPQANTGVLLFIQPPHAVWPKALEIQGKWAEIGSIRPNGGAAEVPVQEVPGVRDAARRPVGDWNTLEVVAKEGKLTVHLNGQKLLETERGDELRSGLIGFQAEGQAVEFRNVRVRVDP